MDVDAVADALYVVDPSDFVKARTDYVRRAREAKDRAAARAIAALKKPTTTGWAVNLLAHAMPEDLDSVLSVGDELRRAQRSLDAELLRELTTRRQQLVRALTTRAGRLAQDRGRPLSDHVLREVSQTLHAAMMDPDVAASVRRGRVLAAASYSGFGTVGLEAVDDAVDEADTGTDTDTETEPETEAGPETETGPEAETGAGVGSDTSGEQAAAARRAAAEQARAELEAARRDAQDAHVSLAEAEHRLGELTTERAETAERLDRLRREIRQVSERVAFLERAEQTAGESVTSARDGALQADGRVAAAEAALSAIEEPGT